MDSKIKKFLVNYNISQEDWDKAAIDWNILESIRTDHTANAEQLKQTAGLIAGIIQQWPLVHSVRWRVKNPDHVIKKIIRKRSANTPKYQDIDIGNYRQKMTDLIGVRALHLFKDDCIEIDTCVRGEWDPVEIPVAYLRQGDKDSLQKQFDETLFNVEVHPAGYRSVHYIVESTPTKNKVKAEIQVRTIFEEGWSEIDHKVRYPNFSEDPLVNYFLTIFNRMAGSADEMGGFVKSLIASLNARQDELKFATETIEAKSAQFNQLTKQVDELQAGRALSKQELRNLKEELERIKKSSNPQLKIDKNMDSIGIIRAVVESLLIGTGSPIIASARTPMPRITKTRDDPTN